MPYTANDFDYFFFEKNLQGDVIAVYDQYGNKIGTYTYDAWGVCSKAMHTNVLIEKNIVIPIGKSILEGVI